MGALSDAPWRLMVCDVLFFLAFGMGNVVIPLLVVAREATRCDASDADACGAVAARRLVVYGLCSGVPQTLVCLQSRRASLAQEWQVGAISTPPFVERVQALAFQLSLGLARGSQKIRRGENTRRMMMTFKFHQISSKNP